MMFSAFNPVASVAAFGDWVYPMLKHQADLDRYTDVIQRDQPTAVIETGTRNGASAEWFARRVGLVVTVDVQPAPFGDMLVRAGRAPDGTVAYLGGSSTDPVVVQRVTQLVHGHRVMVSLDSDHSRAHVLREIELYAPLVSPGCHLVVEDAIIAYLPADVYAWHGCNAYTGNVIEALDEADRAGLLDGFTQDTAIEAQHGGVTMNPAGWWRR